MDTDKLQQNLPILFEHSEVAVAIQNIDASYLFANPAFCNFAGTTPDAVIGQCNDQFLPAKRAKSMDELAQAVMHRKKGVYQEESFLREGSTVCYLLTYFPIWDENDCISGLCLVAMDVTEQRNEADAVTRLASMEQVNADLRNTVETLEQLARTDRLTSAWNRRQFEEALDGEIDRSIRYGHPISMMLLDIDHFKNVNDQYGHLVGDRVLRDVADCIREVMRKSDSLTRWGGEEFIVLTPNTGLSSARILAERICLNIAGHAFAGLGAVTVSIGVAEYTAPESRDDWINRTDRKMYTAKAQGRNRVEFDPLRPAGSVIAEHIDGAFVHLSWKDAFLSGNVEIDTQHRNLFQVSNELLDAVMSRRPADEVAESVTRLIDAIVEHFLDEEAILAKLGFSSLSAHAIEHTQLIVKGHELAKEFAEGTVSIGRLFQYLAYDVVTLHILGADREYFPLTQLSSSGAAAKAQRVRLTH